jgi:hypothetical protein
MELSRLLDELTEAARRVGIAVRIERFEPSISDRRGAGGMCTVHGQRVILVDAGAPLPDRIATVASSLATIDLEGIFLTPIVRATIGAYHRGPATGAADATPRPLARARKRDDSGVD